MSLQTTGMERLRVSTTDNTLQGIPVVSNVGLLILQGEYIMAHHKETFSYRFNLISGTHKQAVFQLSCLILHNP